MAETEYTSRRILWLNRLADEVVRGVTAKIRSDALVPGDDLPSRQELMAEYVTSDGVVDQAIHKLVDAGLATESADGQLRVAEPPTAEAVSLFAEVPEATHADIVAMLELRIGIESEAAALAAERRTDAQFAAISAAVEDFAGRTVAGNPQADYRIHLAIAKASGNRYIQELTDHLGPLLIPGMRMDISAEDRGRRGSSEIEHQAILDAISARDPEAARSAMRRHLTRVLDVVRRTG